MEMMDRIKYDDDFLSPDDFMKVLDLCHTTQYSYGESDDYGLPPTGMISQIQAKEDVFVLFKEVLKEKCPFVRDMSFYRMYINCFAPCENPYFHVDGEGITFLYYVGDQWNLQDGGETQFYVDGNILGIAPIPNRLVMFSGMVQHRATSFRDRYRFTVAIKYNYDHNYK